MTSNSQCDDDSSSDEGRPSQGHVLSAGLFGPSDHRVSIKASETESEEDEDEKFGSRPMSTTGKLPELEVPKSEEQDAQQDEEERAHAHERQASIQEQAALTKFLTEGTSWSCMR